MLPARSFLPMPPAAIFLSAAKEIWKRTPPKTDGFWISSCSPAATAQKDPQRIAPASILAAADVARRGHRRAHRFRRSSNRARAADSGTCRCAPLGRETYFYNDKPAHLRAERGSGSDKRAANDSLYGVLHRFGSRVVHGHVFQHTPAAQEVLKPAVLSSIFGHFW